MMMSPLRLLLLLQLQLRGLQQQVSDAMLDDELAADPAPAAAAAAAAAATWPAAATSTTHVRLLAR